MNAAMADEHLPEPDHTDRARGWGALALMLGTAVAVVVLGALPLLHLLATH